MRFLLDQDVYVVTAKLLEALGHDVARVGQFGLAQAEDEVLLKMAQETNRLFITRDRDFGDPATLVANSTKAVQELGWRPKYDALETIVHHAWAWEQKQIRKNVSDIPN